MRSFFFGLAKASRAPEQTAGLTFERLTGATEQLLQIWLDRIDARETARQGRKNRHRAPLATLGAQLREAQRMSSYHHHAFDDGLSGLSLLRQYA